MRRAGLRHDPLRPVHLGPRLHGGPKPRRHFRRPGSRPAGHLRSWATGRELRSRRGLAAGPGSAVGSQAAVRHVIRIPMPTSRLPRRPDRRARIGDALLVLCGETNIASTGSWIGRVQRPVLDSLTGSGRLKVGLVLNPIHDYMTRYEMRKKRRLLLTRRQDGRLGLEPGQGEGIPPAVDGLSRRHERTDAVVEVPRPFTDRPDIRIGILDLTSL